LQRYNFFFKTPIACSIFFFTSLAEHLRGGKEPYPREGDGKGKEEGACGAGKSRRTESGIVRDAEELCWLCQRIDKELKGLFQRGKLVAKILFVQKIVTPSRSILWRKRGFRFV
jgi:hypothetical protein